MNKKKIIILVILFVAVAGLALSPASAVTKTYTTGKLYFKYNGDSKRPYSEFSKSLNSKTEVRGFYNYPNNKESQHPPNFMLIGIDGKLTKNYNQYEPTCKPTKMIVKFKKTVNGKTVYFTKTFKKFNSWEGFGYYTSYTPKNYFKPQYAVIYYKKV